MRASRGSTHHVSGQDRAAACMTQGLFSHRTATRATCVFPLASFSAFLLRSGDSPPLCLLVPDLHDICVNPTSFRYPLKSQMGRKRLPCSSFLAPSLPSSSSSFHRPVTDHILALHNHTIPQRTAHKTMLSSVALLSRARGPLLASSSSSSSFFLTTKRGLANKVFDSAAEAIHDIKDGALG